jgi:hypothetical protein
MKENEDFDIPLYKNLKEFASFCVFGYNENKYPLVCKISPQEQ